MSRNLRHPQNKVVSLERRLARLFVIVHVAVLAILVLEHVRGERALRAYKQKLTLNGESFDPVALWPVPSTNRLQFSNELAAAVAKLPRSLTQLGGLVNGMGSDEAGYTCRGSRQKFLPRQANQLSTSTWEGLDAAVKAAQPGLDRIRLLMKDPPNAIEGSISERLDDLVFPNYTPRRLAAQSLVTAAISELHNNDLPSALDTIESLQGCVRHNCAEPTLVNFMISVAILGLADTAGWDALQEDDWTEPQLLRFQRACQANKLWPQIPKLIAAERLGRIHAMNLFASQSYHHWVKQHTDILKAFGVNPTNYTSVTLESLTRQWLFHPIWSYAWRAQEELDFLQYSQKELVIAREAADRGCWSHMQSRLRALRTNYRRPSAHWRFYGSLPIVDDFLGLMSHAPVEATQCTYPEYSHAWLSAAKNMIFHEMITTAIALKRYQLRNGKMPTSLSALVPDFLPAMPQDLIDGETLRYRVNPNGSFALYSVGQNGIDDGGDRRDAKSTSPQAGFDSGRDWVWPQVVTAATASR